MRYTAIFPISTQNIDYGILSDTKNLHLIVNFVKNFICDVVVTSTLQCDFFLHDIPTINVSNNVSQSNSQGQKEISI